MTEFKVTCAHCGAVYDRDEHGRPDSPGTGMRGRTVCAGAAMSLEEIIERELGRLAAHRESPEAFEALFRVFWLYEHPARLTALPAT